jgi:hypothetical protein
MSDDDTFDCDWTFDRQLADRLKEIVAAEAADLKASATEALRVHDLSMAGIVESLDNLALESGIAKARPKKGKKYPMTGRHRKSGYQRFVAEHFHHVRAHWDESLPPAARRAPRSVEVFSELAIQWRLLWQEDRDQWNCYAKNTRVGPKPTNDLPKVFPTFLEDEKPGEVVEYPEAISPGARAWLDAEMDRTRQATQPVEAKKVSWADEEAEMGEEFEGAWFGVSRATNGPEEDLAEQSRVGTENFFRMQEGLQLGTSVELK